MGVVWIRYFWVFRAQNAPKWAPKRARVGQTFKRMPKMNSASRITLFLTPNTWVLCGSGIFEFSGPKMPLNGPQKGQGSVKSSKGCQKWIQHPKLPYFRHPTWLGCVTCRFLLIFVESGKTGLNGQCSWSLGRRHSYVSKTVLISLNSS